MISYKLNRNGNKKFISYYTEEDDSIIIHYADGDSLVVDNNKSNRYRLNALETDQVYNMEEEMKKDLINLFCEPERLVPPSIIGATAGVVSSLALSLATDSAFGSIVPPGILSIASTYLAAQLLSQKRFRTLLEINKFKLFLVYKTRINREIKEEAEKNPVVVNLNTINPIIKPRPVKELCINDVNFMSYGEVLKLTRKIDKKERRIRREKAKEDLHKERCESLNLDTEKVKCLRNKK